MMNTILNNPFSFTSTTQLFFGAGQLSFLHTLAMPGHRALVVISNGRSVRVNGVLDRTLSELMQVRVTTILYDGIGPNPTKESIEQGVAIAQRERCDMVVALGGGSVLDAAKLIALNATNPGDLWRYAMSGTGLRCKPDHAPLPWIAIPTTAGTGSEVDAVGVVSNLATKEKLGIFSSFATYAIVDPELMLTVPARLTAYQGFDALFHATEGHISRKRNPFGDMLQQASITRVGHYLPIVCRDGADIGARSAMAYASTMSGYSMVTTTCTVEHSIEHALSAYHELLPHGAGLIMISRAYYGTIIGQHVADDRLVEMAQWLGIEKADRPEHFIDALDALMHQCRVDDLRMSDYGIRPDEFDAMATNALTVMERLATQDIRPLTHNDIVTILQQSYR